MKPEPNEGSCDVDRGIRDTDTAVSPKREHSLLKTAGSALLYGTTSFLLTVVSKIVLTEYGLPPPHVIGLGQVTTTVIILYAAHVCRYISLPPFDALTINKVFPLPVVYLSNVLFGLSSTKELSLPMFTVLRHLSALMIMLWELCVFGTHPTLPARLSVYTLVFGAAVAASSDLAFNARGYVMVLLHDASTASYVLIVKNKPHISYLGEYGLLFYNSIMVIPFLTAYCWLEDDHGTIMEFSFWTDHLLIGYFVLCCVLDVLLNYSMMLCMRYNSALTTAVVGCIKNISITYLGTVIGGDYVFSLINFVGINVGLVGNLVYSWVMYSQKQCIKTRVAQIYLV